jgi:hypothetical protein
MLFYCRGLAGETAMREYVVYRHGWNETNQDPANGLPEKMPVLRVWADDPDDACRRAAPQVTLLGNQRLSAEPADELDAKENNMNRKASGPEVLEQT